MMDSERILSLFDTHIRSLMSAEADEDPTDAVLTEFSRFCADYGQKTFGSDRMGRLRVAIGLIRAKRAFERGFFEAASLVMVSVANEPLYLGNGVDRNDLRALADLTREFFTQQSAVSPTN